MKMVKSLLLGSAAGLVAAAGAQAADLPVKAKPVEYVKVCSLYGAGFFYVPGTDMCLKIGGYVRAEWAYNYGENLTAGPWVSPSMQNTRIGGARDSIWRVRAYATFDTRQQTAYGTLRTFLQIGINNSTSGTEFNANRAFMQIAGFTVGLASSYFDHYSAAAVAYLVDISSDTGDPGRKVFAYTAQLGNGVSASLSAEEPDGKESGIWNATLGANNAAAALPPATTLNANNPTLGVGLNNGAKKNIVPDIVGNIRIDQAWGSAQVMAAVKEVHAAYYGTTLGGGQARGYPSDKWGWAVGGGVKLNLPMIAPGDYLAAQVAYSVGATRYVANTPGSSGQASFKGGSSLGYGFYTDAVYAGSNATNATASSLELTTAWGVAAALEHFWTPSLRTSVHGHYVEVRYNAMGNALLCAAQAQGTLVGAIRNTNANCDQNWSQWQIGSRTQWNVTKSFYMGFDVIYAKLRTASKGQVVTYTALGGQAQPSGLRTLEDQDVVAVRARWHRELEP
jgi:hypothetical protein